MILTLLLQMIDPPIIKSNIIEEVNATSIANAKMYLSVPKPTKQFLISPSTSSPVGWSLANEDTPCVEVRMISAIATLVPGQVHEIHAGNESQPGIYVEVCEVVKDGVSKLNQ